MKLDSCFNNSHFAIIKFNKNALRLDKWDGICTQNTLITSTLQFLDTNDI